MKNQKYKAFFFLFLIQALLIGLSNIQFGGGFYNGEQESLHSSDINFENATLISDGYNGFYWNDATSEDPAIIVDSNNVIHAVWQDGTDGVWGIDYEIMHVKYDSINGWSNITVISDGYGGSYWNDGYSSDPAIAVDSHDRVHVIWEDGTDGKWGIDYEIFHVFYEEGTGWSNASLVSNGYGGSYWNDDHSFDPAVTVDDEDNVHAVWYDYTDGVWGSDTEIMYATYTQGVGWSNATVISDGFNGTYWNDAGSNEPKIAVENGKVHVVWTDQTDGEWGTDKEIMYAIYDEGIGWSNATVISDGFNGTFWNNEYSQDASIACVNGEVHVIWEDDTDGIWGSDYEIMHVVYSQASGWSNVTIISDGYNDVYWNDAQSYSAEILTDYNGHIHVVWEDYTDGKWGIDTEIMYINFTSDNGWTNASVISDGFGGVYWNDGLSRYPAFCLDSGVIYVVWQDGTDGVWGTDYEIMFTTLTIPPPVSTTTTPAIPFGTHFLIGMLFATLGLIYYIKRKI